MQEGDKKHSYFPHKWVPDNCNIYVASVKGKGFVGCVRSPENRRECGADSDLLCIISRAHSTAGSLLDVFPNSFLMKILILKVTSRDISTRHQSRKGHEQCTLCFIMILPALVCFALQSECSTLIDHSVHLLCASEERGRQNYVNRLTGQKACQQRDQKKRKKKNST